MRPPGSSKSGLTFDHILSRLQGELQKSRDTGAELSNLTGTLGEIGDTIGGNLVSFSSYLECRNQIVVLQPQHLPSYPQSLPPVRPPAPQQPPEANASDAAAVEAAPLIPPEALTDLQSQLQTTQSSLASHHDKIRALEGVLQEHEAIKREVGVLKGVVDSLRSDDGSGASSEEDEDPDPDSDTRSINTIIGHPHELESVREEDEDQLAADAAGMDSSSSEEHDTERPEDGETEEEENDEERRRRHDELGRPRTPEPTSLGLGIDFRRSPTKTKFGHSRLSPTSSSSSSGALDELTQRLSALSNQLESALELSSTLQAQHAAAQGTIKVLEEKVERLEGLVRVATPPAPTSSLSPSTSSLPPTTTLSDPAPEAERESLTQLLSTFQKSVEGQWSSVRLEWKEERERLNRAREEFENKMKVLENGIEEMHSFRSLSKTANRNPLGMVGNGEVKGGGLVTPPSPRSLSSDSNAPRRRRRGRGGSRSGSRVRGRSASQATSTTLASESDDPADHRTAFEEDLDQDRKPNVFPITPESSVRLGGSATDSIASSASTTAGSATEGTREETSLTIGKHEFTEAVRIIVLWIWCFYSSWLMSIRDRIYGM